MAKKPPPPRARYDVTGWFGDQTLLVKVAVSLAALISICTAAWSFGDYTKTRPVILNEFETAFDQTQQNTLAILSIEFGLLDGQYKKGILDEYSQRRRCELAYQLRYFTIDGCNFSTFVPQPAPQQ